MHQFALVTVMQEDMPKRTVCTAGGVGNSPCDNGLPVKCFREVVDLDFTENMLRVACMRHSFQQPRYIADTGDMVVHVDVSVQDVKTALYERIVLSVIDTGKLVEGFMPAGRHMGDIEMFKVRLRTDRAAFRKVDHEPRGHGGADHAAAAVSQFEITVCEQLFDA